MTSADYDFSLGDPGWISYYTGFVTKVLWRAALSQAGGTLPSVAAVGDDDVGFPGELHVSRLSTPIPRGLYVYHTGTIAPISWDRYGINTVEWTSRMTFIDINNGQTGTPKTGILSGELAKASTNHYTIRPNPPFADRRCPWDYIQAICIFDDIGIFLELEAARSPLSLTMSDFGETRSPVSPSNLLVRSGVPSSETLIDINIEWGIRAVSPTAGEVFLKWYNIDWTTVLGELSIDITDLWIDVEKEGEGHRLQYLGLVSNGINPAGTRGSIYVSSINRNDNEPTPGPSFYGW